MPTELWGSLALRSSPLSACLVVFASHGVQGSVTQIRSPPGCGSGYEKSVTPNRVPKQCKVGTACCESALAIQSVTHKISMPPEPEILLLGNYPKEISQKKENTVFVKLLMTF